MKESKYKVGDHVHILLKDFDWIDPELGPLHTIFDPDEEYEIINVYTENGRPQYEIEGHCMLLFDDEDLSPFENNKE